MIHSRSRRGRPAALLALTVAAGLALSACSSDSGSGGGGGDAKSVNLVAYSVPKPAYDALAAAFKQTAQGKGVTVNASYGPSGTQSKNVLGGQANIWTEHADSPRTVDYLAFPRLCAVAETAVPIRRPATATNCASRAVMPGLSFPAKKTSPGPAVLTKVKKSPPPAVFPAV